MTQRTFAPKKAEIQRDWWIVDAEGKTLGRLASIIAAKLRGKNKPHWAPHVDVGDYVVVVNAEKVQVTGNKETQKHYYRHSQYPGGFKAIKLRDVRAQHPDRLLKSAVRGMLPHNVLGDEQFKKLKVYVGPTHPHNSHALQEISLDQMEQAGALRHANN